MGGVLRYHEDRRQYYSLILIDTSNAMEGSAWKCRKIQGKVYADRWGSRSVNPARSGASVKISQRRDRRDTWTL